MNDLKDKVTSYLCTSRQTGEDHSDLACPCSRYGTTTREVATQVALAVDAISEAIALSDDDWQIWADQLMEGAVNDTSEVENLINRYGDQDAKDQLTILS